MRTSLSKELADQSGEEEGPRLLPLHVLQKGLVARAGTEPELARRRVAAGMQIGKLLPNGCRLGCPDVNVEKLPQKKICWDGSILKVTGAQGKREERATAE